MTDRLLPDPRPGAGKLVRFMGEAAAASLGPVGGFLKILVDHRNQESFERDINILLDEVESVGISRLSDLSEGQRERFIPHAYRFCEQVRMRDYQHNLRVLAKIITQGLTDPDGSDVGTVARAARRLEMLTHDELVALAATHDAFNRAEIAEDREEHESYHYISSSDLHKCLIDNKIIASHMQCDHWLHELSVRGVLTASSSPQHSEGIFYYRNSAFYEIIEAVLGVAAAIKVQESDEEIA